MSANDKGSEHYKRMAIEPWDVIDTWPEEQRIGFYRGNLLKYTLRLGSKDAAISEAKKAQHYAEKLVETLEQQRTNDMVRNMQGNNLSMSICDSMSVADAFLYDMRQTELSWNEHHEARMDVIGQNGATGEHYSDKVIREMMQEQDKAGIYNAPKQDDGWIEWKGGECPASKGSRVDVMYRDGVVVGGSIAVGLDWQHGNEPDGEDIVAYKIAKGMSHEGEEAQV